MSMNAVLCFCKIFIKIFCLQKSLGRIVSKRQCEDKERTASFCVCHLKRALVRCGNLLCHRKPESVVPFLLTASAVKPFKDLVLFCCRNAGAVILHADRDFFIIRTIGKKK